MTTTETIRVVWMDDQIKDYETEAWGTNQQATTLTLTGRTRSEPVGTRRSIRIPLANVRWWGKPGEEVAW